MNVKKLTPSNSTIDEWIYEWGETRNVSELEDVTEFIVHKTVEYVIRKLKDADKQ